MEWEQVDKLLKDQIASQTDVKKGYEAINQFLTANKLPVAVLDIDGLQNEFKEWLREVVEKEPIPKYIHSIYFGLAKLSFPDIDDGAEKTTVYLAGSSMTPEQDPVDWACEPEYLPDRRYLVPDEFEKVDQVIESNDGLDGDYEVLVFNGLLNLVARSVVHELKDILLSYEDRKLGFLKTVKTRDSLFVGTGFDSGDTYVLGELRS